MTETDDRKESRTHNTGFASGGVKCKLGALCPAHAGFSACRQFCAPKSRTNAKRQTVIGNQ